MSDASDAPAPERAPLVLRAGIASIWLLTGVLVVHPHYREVGHEWLAKVPLVKLPDAVMYVTCAFEVLLGLVVLLGRASTPVTALQVGMVSAFTAILAVADPMLLVHPFGMLTKNLPIVAFVVLAWLVEREGWTPRALALLRGGVAVIWLTEGLFPKILFQQESERQVVARSGLVPVDPELFLYFMGVCQLVAGVATLATRGRVLRVVLALELLGLAVLPLLVGLPEPEVFVHPFGPLTKNLPIIAGTIIAMRRLA